MYITGNSSILLNILAWIGLWCGLSFGLTFIYIALCEISRWLNRRSLVRFNKKYDVVLVLEENLNDSTE